MMTSKPGTRSHRLFRGTRDAASDLPSQVAWTGFGLFLLFSFVWLGAMSQVGVARCAVCSDGVCSGSTTDCPGTYGIIVLVLFLLAIASAIIAVGLSVALVRLVTTIRLPPGAGFSPARLSIEFLAPFMAFYGWGILAWGLVLPLNIFGLCYYGACVYPYVLQGIPLSLAVIGGVVLGAGAVFLALLWRIRKAETTAVVRVVSPT